MIHQLLIQKIYQFLNITELFILSLLFSYFFNQNSCWHTTKDLAYFDNQYLKTISQGSN